MLWALSEPEKLEIKAVTIVAGNQTLEKTTRNALRVLTFAGANNIPVAMGADHPLMRPSIFEEGVTEMVHGESGLDGPAMPEPGFAPEKMSALQLLIKTIEESEEKITLVAHRPADQHCSAVPGAPRPQGEDRAHFADGAAALTPATGPRLPSTTSM